MLRKFINRISQEVADCISISYPYKTQVAVTHSIFSYIGIAKLRNLLDEAEKRGEKYVSLAEMFGQVQRENLAKENSDIIHNYYELLPKLNAYSQAFNKVIEPIDGND